MTADTGQALVQMLHLIQRSSESGTRSAEDGAIPTAVFRLLCRGNLTPYLPTAVYELLTVRRRPARRQGHALVAALPDQIGAGERRAGYRDVVVDDRAVRVQWT